MIHQSKNVPTRKNNLISAKDVETSRNIAVICHDFLYKTINCVQLSTGSDGAVGRVVDLSIA